MNRWVAAWCFLALCDAVAAVAEESPDAEQSAGVLIEPAVGAIDRGLAYLAAQQNEDGSFRSNSMGRNPAVVGLGGIAFLSF